MDLRSFLMQHSLGECNVLEDAGLEILHWN
jgi:hypothetical protein